MFRPVIASTFPLNQIITCHKPLNRHTLSDNRIADHGSDCWVVTQAFSAERSNLVGIEQLFLNSYHAEQCLCRCVGVSTSFWIDNRGFPKQHHRVRCMTEQP